MGTINLSQWAIRHPALISFLIFAIGIGGALAYFQLGRAEDPSFTIKNVNVSAIWPGATTQEMQDQVTDRIEKKLRELAYFDKSTTYTKPGFTSIGIDFKDSTPARLVPMLFLDLRKKLGDMRGDLPRRSDRTESSMTSSAMSTRCSIRSRATARPTHS